MASSSTAAPAAYSDPALEQLHIALFKGKRKEATQLLAQKPALANGLRSDGLTGLHIVASSGSKSLAKLLLEKGASLAARETHGATALSLAAQNGHARLVKLLAKHGADPNDARDDGAMPLYLAAQGGHTDCVRALLKARAQVDAQMINGASALFIAAQKGRLECVTALLEGGADMNAPVNDVTPLEAAIREGHFAVVQALLSHRASVVPSAKGGVAAISRSEASRLVDNAMRKLSTLMETVDTSLTQSTPPQRDEAALLVPRLKKKEMDSMSKKQLREQYKAALKALTELEQSLRSTQLMLQREHEAHEKRVLYWKTAFVLLDRTTRTDVDSVPAADVDPAKVCQGPEEECKECAE